MITLKSEDEIALIRKAGIITRLALARMKEAVRPGVSTQELDEIAVKTIKENGGQPAFKGYRGFPANICTSINEVVVHGIPSKRRLKEGDIISIDVGVRLNGYCADAASTFAVGEIFFKILLLFLTADPFYFDIDQSSAVWSFSSCCYL